jgi:hypothetical protein
MCVINFPVSLHSVIKFKKIDFEQKIIFRTRLFKEHIYEILIKRKLSIITILTLTAKRNDQDLQLHNTSLLVNSEQTSVENFFSNS